ncbi:hypothetical protein SAMN05660909_04349 [Chitinophaga terrae (ex Kim and Jung 2007)]|uniref:Cytochrome B n=1 Tax=Chitinophaga terrae (ex Kim and Jung 2007) TaxID=408074 RepID=A0A1H4FF91_9BACT|nr:hypothetical protein [Chitinophaga terrae (ex Kim and Jung 2007)]MDQ0110153.1 putative membrane protein AbrB (regulator of aidB expression) [Chitinophaga terrae (ex Kim and Jung 2007)]SEA95697.1 hypothetical protein SAMN05660909_04349 [Chitinophaga terrae (ex Kim and Jung 2007)]
MYPILLAIHSLVRWLVVITLILSIFRAYAGWKNRKTFSQKDESLLRMTVGVAQLQMLIGIVLYFVSPLVRYFFGHLSKAIKLREIRFFGLEHSTMMITSVILITIGAGLSAKRTDDAQRFRTIAIWFTIAFIILFFSIPWQFSPFTHRPLFRSF